MDFLSRKRLPLIKEQNLTLIQPVMRKKALIFTLLFTGSILSKGQNVLIEIKDKQTQEGIPFANIEVRSVDGFSKNTTSGPEGITMIINLDGSYSIEVACMGYKRTSVPFTITKGKLQEVNIEMEPDVIALSEVIIESPEKFSYGCGYGCYYICDTCRPIYCYGHTTYITVARKDSTSEEENKVLPLPTIKFYPNPTSGTVYVEPGEDVKELYVTDASGRLIEQYNTQGIQRLSIELGNYSPGIYFINYPLGNQRRSEKIALVR